MNIKTIKNLLTSIAAFLVILLIFQACEKNQNTNFVGSHYLEVNKVKETTTDGQKVWIVAKEFTDSRCPINADCVWAGVATAQVNFKENDEEQLIELCLGACDVVKKPKTQEIQLNNATYIVELTDLSPYPIIGNKAENAKATISIKKK